MPTTKRTFTSHKGEQKKITIVLAHQQITVHNHTKATIYVANYFRIKTKIRCVFYRLEDEAHAIEPGKEKAFNKPSYTCPRSKNARIFFSSQPANLPDYLVGSVAQRIGSKSVYLHRTIHINSHKGLLCPYTRHEWKHLHQYERLRGGFTNTKARLKRVWKTPVPSDFTGYGREKGVIKNVIRTNNFMIDSEQVHIPPKDKELQNWRVQSSPLVTRSSESFIGPPMQLGKEEDQALKLRLDKVRLGLEKYLGRQGALDGKKTPVISLCCSGGSYRALVSCMGYFRGMEETGLMDCFSYMSTLSGSCWAVALWMCGGGNTAQTIERIYPKLSLTFSDCFQSDSRALLFQLIKQKKQLRLPTHRLMDLYSVMLAAQLLNDVDGPEPGFYFPFTRLNESCGVRDGGLPIPIFTSVFKEPHDYEWLELTPFEVGSEYLGGFIDANYFGCSYLEGYMERAAPPLTMGQLLSFTTSAICLTTRNLLKQIFGDVVKNSASDNILNHVLPHPDDGANHHHHSLSADLDSNSTMTSDIFSDEEDFFSDDDETDLHLKDIVDEDNISPAQTDSAYSLSTASSRSDSTANLLSEGQFASVDRFDFMDGKPPLIDKHGRDAQGNKAKKSTKQKIIDKQNEVLNGDSAPSFPFDSEVTSVDQITPQTSIPDMSTNSSESMSLPTTKPKIKQKTSMKQNVAKSVYKFVGEYDWLADAYVISPTTFPNFMYGLEGPMRAKKYLQLVDAGFGFCLPFPPLFRQARLPDIIIILEMSAPPECEVGHSLFCAVNWAKNHNVRLPFIDFNRVRTPFANGEQVIIFEDPDRSVPAIAYIVLQQNLNYSDFDPIQNQKDGGFCNTFKSSMTKEEIDLLAGLTTHTIKEIDEKLKDLISRRVDTL